MQLPNLNRLLILAKDFLINKKGQAERFEKEHFTSESVNPCRPTTYKTPSILNSMAYNMVTKVIHVKDKIHEMLAFIDQW